MRRFPRVLGALAGGSVLLATACGQSTPGSTSPAPGPGADTAPHARKLVIVAAAYPFQFVAERVAGARGEVSSLTPAGAEPHDLELTLHQVASLSGADLIVYENGFQAAVDQAVAQSGNAQALDTTTVVPLQPLAAEHDHGAEHASAQPSEGEGHEDTHEHEGRLDPHVWQDPTNLGTIATAVAERLAGRDPEYAAEYRSNAQTFVAQMQSLDREFSAGLTGCRRREFITTHEAFGYLATRYTLTQIGISGLSPDAEPSPARIAEVHEEAEEHGITTIFYETLVSPDVAKSIAGDLGLKTDVLDPIEGVTPESRGSDYVAIMKANLAALRAANACR